MTPPLTDEELAMFGHHRAGSSGRWCATCAHKWPCLSARLIADLRAARAEVERLRAQNAEYVAFIATVVRVPNAP